jgi:hypothetical protein
MHGHGSEKVFGWGRSNKRRSGWLCLIAAILAGFVYTVPVLAQPPLGTDQFATNPGGNPPVNPPVSGGDAFATNPGGGPMYGNGRYGRDPQCGGTDRSYYNQLYKSSAVVIGIQKMTELYRRTNGQIWIRCGACRDQAICWPRPGYQDLIASNGTGRAPPLSGSVTATGPMPDQSPCRAPSPNHLRLYRQPWLTNPQLLRALLPAKAQFQSNQLGRGHDMAFDEYSITITQMPGGLTPEQLLLDLAMDMNGTVDGYGPAGTIFDGLTRFIRREKGSPKLGELIDIDIPGDSGTVQLVEIQPDHFVLQTVTSPEKGTHPVSGARQFGFRRVGSNILFYTQGAERPYNEILRGPGRLAQDSAWRSFMTALGEMINHYGGVADVKTVRGDRVDTPCHD